MTRTVRLLRGWERWPHILARFGTLLICGVLAALPLRAADKRRQNVEAGAGHRFALIVVTGKLAPAQPGDTLRAPQNDAVLMAELLMGRFGFAPKDIRIVGLENAGQDELRPFGSFAFGPPLATRPAILAGFSWMRRRVASAQDTAVVYYSGHGTKVIARTKEERQADSGDDEAIVPDGAKNVNDLILDDEMGSFLEALPTPNVTLLADACFSGGLLKSGSEAGTTSPYPPEGSKQWNVADRLMVAKQPRGSARKETWHDVQRSNRSLLAACLDDEAASTNYWHRGGPAFSPFTLALCRFLWRTPGSVRWQDLSSRRDPLIIAPEIGRLMELLGGHSQNPFVYHSASMPDIFLVPTPNYRLERLLTNARHRHQPAPIGQFIIDSVTGDNKFVPASEALLLNAPVRPSMFSVQ